MTSEALVTEEVQAVAQNAGFNADQKNAEALNTLLEKMRQASSDTTDQGRRFELLAKDFLSNDKKYRDLFSKVQTYKE